MPRALRLLLLLLALLPAGCGIPRTGGGGMAESKAPRVEDHDLATPLHLRLACEVDRVDSLREALGARGVLSGRVLAAVDLSTRSQREFHGALFADSARTLDRLQAEITALEPLLPDGVQLPPECPAA